MAHIENTIQNCKYKHLSLLSVVKFLPYNRAGRFNREIARRARAPSSKIVNELKRGTTTQLKTGRKIYTVYFPEIEQAIYKQNRKNCGGKSKLLVAMEFIHYVCEKILDEDWSPDPVVGFGKRQKTGKTAQSCRLKPYITILTSLNYMFATLIYP